MKIYKDTHPGFDIQSAIESEIQKATAEIVSRNEGKNFPFKSQTWALEIVRLKTEWTFINKTRDEVQQDKADEAQIDAELKEEKDRAEILVKAKSDPLVRDQLIDSEMTKAGFDKLTVLMWSIEESDGKDRTEIREARAAKKQEIIDEING